ncbi:hypothetical protein ACIA8K_11740 [Catenuloplanes sp. NPDC051500]|uniref:hypothetical protein n=1 Tax=Catenuloplanes sp. NPDC051500 TaxID=3363959 RepID=UPI0037B09761
MTRSMTVSRRALRLAVGAAAVALAVTGCSAGQIAETALKQASVSGVSANSADGKLAVRGLAVAYEGVEGYPAGGSAPVSVALVNQTRNPLTVQIGLGAPEGSDPTVTSARQVLLTSGAETPAGAGSTPTPTGSTSPTPKAPESPEGEAAAPNTSGSATPDASGSVTPSAGGSATPTAPVTPAVPAGQPAQITIPASSIVTFTPESAQQLSLVGLAAALRSGMAVTLTFQVTQDGQQSELLTVKTPVAIPLTAAPREAGEAEEHE